MHEGFCIPPPSKCSHQESNQWPCASQHNAIATKLPLQAWGALEGQLMFAHLLQKIHIIRHKVFFSGNHPALATYAISYDCHSTIAEWEKKMAGPMSQWMLTLMRLASSDVASHNIKRCSKPPYCNSWNASCISCVLQPGSSLTLPSEQAAPSSRLHRWHASVC